MQMREELYQVLGSLASSVSGLYESSAAQPAWVAALVVDLDMLTNQHLRLAMRHIYICLVKACPPVHRHDPTLHSISRLPDPISWHHLLSSPLCPQGCQPTQTTFISPPAPDC